MEAKFYKQNTFGTFVCINTTKYNNDGYSALFVCESEYEMEEIGFGNPDEYLAMEIGEVWTIENKPDIIDHEGVILTRIG